jgi:hypothetical protein
MLRLSEQSVSEQLRAEGHQAKGGQEKKARWLPGAPSLIR